MDSKLRAEEAARLLANPVLHQALEDMKGKVVQQWSACSARDSESREWLWMMHQNAMRFEEILKGYMAEGRIDDFNRKQDNWFKKVTSIVKR